MAQFLQNKTILGTQYAREIRNSITIEAQSIFAKTGIKPKLVVVLVGSNPASQIYVANKHKFASQCGIDSQIINLEEGTTEANLLQTIELLNQDRNTHAILVQMPLPKHINGQNVINAINPQKDVDGFHPQNIGALFTNTVTERSLLPCTPLGCMHIIRSLIPSFRGLNAVIIGSSNIVGKPLAGMLINEGATVSVLNSATKNKQQFTTQADILIAACGVPNIIGYDDIKTGVIIIDVGINRLPNGQITGDCNFEECEKKAQFITPVPGGIGPMTIAMLLQNTLISAKCILGIF